MSDNSKTNFNEYRCMLKLVSSAVNKTAADIKDCKPDWKTLYIIAKDSSLVNLVSYGISNLPEDDRPSEKIIKLFEQYRNQYLAKDCNQLYELDLLYSECEKQGIDVLFVKGTVMKSEYPRTDMRYMGDVDMLVKPGDMKKAENMLKKIGYSNLSKGKEVHDEYKKPPFMMLEVHRNLVSKSFDREYNYFKNIWDRAVLKKDFTHVYIPTLEDTYIFMTAHAVKHYYFGGIAPRILLDYYVYLENRKDELDFDYIYRVLDGFGCTKFDKTVKKLAYSWFAADGAGLQDDDLSMFIVTGGTYGRIENNVAIRSALLTKDGEKPSRLRFIISQMFPSRNKLKERFPVVEKSPLLVPFIWVKLIFVRIFIDRDFSFKTRKHYNAINSEKIERIKKINKELGLGGKKIN